MADPRVWDRALAVTAQEEPVFVLGSSDDGTNLQAALRLSHAVPGARIIALSPIRSHFAAQLASTARFEVVSTGDLLKDRIEDDWLA